MASAAAPHDKQTVKYFDEHAPEYSIERFAFAARAIGERATPESSLVDLGCGAGNTLAHLKATTKISDVVGVDVSETLLARTRDQVGCPVHRASIIDSNLPAVVGRRFDFAVVAAVLHHLIGPTRRASRAHARAAIANALELLEPGGYLVILEPVWYPRIAMDGVFYVKKALSSISSRRVFVGDHYWANLGAPVVSYYGNEELVEMIETRGARIVDREIEPASLGRLDVLFTRTNSTFVAQKT